MSGGADSRSGALPEDWRQLERAVEEASVSLGRWKRRAAEAGEEVERLRRSLEELAAERDSPDDLSDEVKRLKAENAALRSRMQQARKRIGGLLQRLSALDIEL